MVPIPPDDITPLENANVAVPEDPPNFKAAIESDNSNEWEKAITDEYIAHIKNNTWDVVNLPKDRKTIGNRFILKTKFNSTGTVERRKARLVAKGYTQQHGIDFIETFSPVARISSIRMLMALAVEYYLQIHQMDAVTALLNGEISEEFYMDLPEGMERILSNIVSSNNDPSFADKANSWLKGLKSGANTCKLNKAIYGLKQSGRQWYMRLDEELRALGLTPLETDHCIYVKKNCDCPLIGLNAH